MHDPQTVVVKDLLVWRVANPAAAATQAHALHRETGALVVVLGPGESLESLSEAEMADHGWVRGYPRAGIANL